MEFKMKSIQPIFILWAMFFLISSCSPTGEETTNSENNSNNVNNINNVNNLNNLNNVNNTNLNNVNNVNNTSTTNNINNLNNTTTNNLNNSNNLTPAVAFVSPLDGAMLTNPVVFTITASNVEKVVILADDWPLSDPWDPQSTLQLEYSFTGTGFVRHMVLQGLDINGNVLVEDYIDLTVESDDPGTLLGTFYNTYYYFALEADFSGVDDTTVYDGNCNVITQVPVDFHSTLCMQGSGILENGTVVSYSNTCSCAVECPVSGGRVCYLELDPNEFPWGQGSTSNAIVPLRSWAVDNSFISSGTVLYAEEWDGVSMPSVDGLGGFVHDGCFRADDVGGMIDNYHYDFFAGTHDMWQALAAIYDSYSDFTVYTDTPHCTYLEL
jgi:3D (Asp-Asp-Asp) domain-containing protein